LNDLKGFIQSLLMTQFSNVNNKKLLWKVLQQSGVFNEIHQDKKNEVVGVFQAKIDEIDLVRGLSLVDMNKQFIVEMTDSIKHFKQIRTPSKPQVFDDIIKQRDESISDIIHHSPPEINFAQSIDDVPTQTEIDRMLQETITRREYDISKLAVKNVTFETDTEIKDVQTEHTIAERLDNIDTKLNEILSLLKK